MGNILNYIKPKKNVYVKQCPHCKHFFSSGKETKKHMKTCIYNQDNIHHIGSEFSIYSEQIN